MTLAVFATNDALGGEVGAALRQACAIAEAEVAPFAADVVLEAGSVLVDVLERGERTVPVEVRSALRSDSTGVLLLSMELLTRPLATLHAGRLQIVGTPASPENIAHGLRAVAAHSGRTSELAQASGPLRMREHWGAGFWAGTVVAGAADDHAAAVFELVAANPSISLPGVHGSPTITLAPGAGDWTFSATTAAPAAWLLSARRLPRAWNLRAPTAATRTQMASASGDVTLLADFDLTTEEVERLVDDVRHRGSPSALRRLGDFVTRTADVAAAVLLEAI